VVRQLLVEGFLLGLGGMAGLPVPTRGRNIFAACEESNQV